MKLALTIKTISIFLTTTLVLFACDTTNNKTTLSPSDSGGTTRAEVAPNVENIKGHMNFLAHDLLEGRETGARGHEIASLYIANEFQKYGLKPAGENNTFMQRVPFRKGLLVQESPSLSISKDGKENKLIYLDDYLVGPNMTYAEAMVSAPLVFVGYGIVAPELNHDDYANVDVEGKIVVGLYGKPASFPSELGSHVSSDAQKISYAADRGAIGYITIQTPKAEEYRSFDRLKLYVNASQMTWIGKDGIPGNKRPEIKGSAFLNLEASKTLFENAPVSLASIHAQLEDDIAPQGFDLAVTATISYKTTHTSISSPNVVGLVEGSDPILKNEYVVYTAHSDHLGISKSFEEDKINNGAMDNATGTGVLMETARMFSQLAVTPKRSILFVAVTGEEKGLLGADYFVRNPTRALESLVANVNLDMPLLTYEFADVIAFGAAHSSMGEKVAKAVANANIKLTDDPWPKLNLFTRSDHYAFVKQGVPAIFLVTGIESKSPNIDGSEVLNNFLANHYHRPSDDMSQAFVWKAARTFTQVNFEIGLTLGNDPERPTWNEDSFFGQTFGRD